MEKVENTPRFICLFLAKTIIVLLPDEQKLYFTAGMPEDPATGIKIPVEQVFEDLV